MIAAALAEQGAEIPEDLLGVDVWPSAAPYRDAFHVLSAARGRAVGMYGSIPQAIEYSEIVCFARANGFADSMTELEEFVSIIQAQDTTYRDHIATAQAKK